jgi:hypothetical protein
MSPPTPVFRLGDGDIKTSPRSVVALSLLHEIATHGFETIVESPFLDQSRHSEPTLVAVKTM